MSRFPLTSVRALGILVVLVAFAIGMAFGCRRDADGDASAQVVDMQLMAFLSEARALHHQANLKEEAGDLAGAASALERLTTARRPHDGTGPEIEEVLADAFARLAEIRLKQGALDLAAVAIERGLEHAPEPTYFRGHLVEVHGLVEEARSVVLADAGKAEEASKARDHAIELLEDVVRIQERVIQRSLDADAGKKTR